MSEIHTPTANIAAATKQAHVLARALPFLRRHAGAPGGGKYGGPRVGADTRAQPGGHRSAALKPVGPNPQGGTPGVEDGGGYGVFRANGRVEFVWEF